MNNKNLKLRNAILKVLREDLEDTAVNNAPPFGVPMKPIANPLRGPLHGPTNAPTSNPMIPPTGNNPNSPQVKPPIDGNGPVPGYPRQSQDGTLYWVSPGGRVLYYWSNDGWRPIQM